MDTLHHLREALDALPGCMPHRARPHIALPREGYQKSAYLAEECIWLKASCKEEARERLLDHHLAAIRGMDAYTGEHETDSFMTILQSVLQEQTAELRRELEHARSGATAEVLDELRTLLNPDAVMEQMEAVNADLRARHTLGAPGAYLPLIRYEVCDPSHCEEGVMWLVAKAFCRYGYDLLDAIHRMEEDAAKALWAFQEDFCTQAERNIRALIVEPAQRTLTQLDRLTKGGNPT